jgi:hypothetical protein
LASGWAVVLWSLPAAAQPLAPRCAEANVTLAGTLDPSWVDAVNAACSSLMSLTDRDLAARLEVGSDPPGVRVTVRLADGRFAERRANRPEELASLLEALVALPPASSEAPLDPGPAKAVETPAPDASAPAKPLPTTPAASKRVPLALDIAVLGTTHIAGAPATLALGAVVSAGVDIGCARLVGCAAETGAMVAQLEGEARSSAVIRWRARACPPSAFSAARGRPRRRRRRPGRRTLRAAPRRPGTATLSGDVRPRLSARSGYGDGLSATGLLGFELSAEARRDGQKNKQRSASSSAPASVGACDRIAQGPG